MTAREYKGIREQLLDWSQQKLADTLGVTIRTIQRREAEAVPILHEANLAIRYICLKTLRTEPELHGRTPTPTKQHKAPRS